jgi:Peptidase family M13.
MVDIPYVQKIVELSGDNGETAKKDAAILTRLEMQLAKASLRRVERRDPMKLKHLRTCEEPRSLAPNFDWKVTTPRRVILLSKAERRETGFLQRAEYHAGIAAHRRVTGSPAFSCGKRRGADTLTVVRE